MYMYTYLILLTALVWRAFISWLFWHTCSKC